jgi:hypothetical protein
MNCINCGRSLQPDFKFCPECATPVEFAIPKEETAVEVKEEVPKKKKGKLRKILLITMIAALSFSALLGIWVILFGQGSEIEGKILLTTTSIGGFSLLSLCCSLLIEKSGKQSVISWLGFVSCIGGFLAALLLIWFQEIFDFNIELLLKWLLIFIIFSVSFAHMSILLLIKPQKLSVWVVTFTTVILIAMVAILLLLMVFELIDYDKEWFFKLVAVLAILDVLGTIVSPIMSKIAKNNPA